MSGWGLAVVAILAASCGRIGYDASEEDAAAGDVLTDLVARYTFDVGIGSDALGRNDASCDPACPAQSANGYQGLALDMVGGPDHLVVADDGSSFDQSGGFTISGWARYRDYSARTCLFTKRLGLGGSNSWALCTEAGGAPFFYSCSPCDFARAAQIVPLDTWVHLAASFDGSTKSLYVDGALADQIEGTVNFDTNDLNIGGDRDTAFGYATDGLIDDIRLYDRALSAGEIAAIAGF